MIIDTSALVAVASMEPGWQTVLEGLVSAPCIIPAPVLTELALLFGGRLKLHRQEADRTLSELLANGARVVAFEYRHAEITATARMLYGKGNGSGGLLNFGDLMVYAIAKQTGLPLLCTGSDFASTDLVLHPASRIDP